jgi:hypothetical protein
LAAIVIVRDLAEVLRTYWIALWTPDGFTSPG